MKQTFVIKSARYWPSDESDPPQNVDDLGFSLVQLMRLSDGDATGVRANLQVRDQDALTDLARHYMNNTRLEWRLTIGGGGGAFSVVLRWTKFDRLTGCIQLVRTAVKRDLIAEARPGGGSNADDQKPSPPSSRPPSQNDSEDEQKVEQETMRDSENRVRSLTRRITDLWTLLARRGKNPKTG